MMFDNAKTVEILLLVSTVGAVLGFLFGTVAFFTPGWLKVSIYYKNGVKKKIKLCNYDKSNLMITIKICKCIYNAATERPAS